MASTATKTPKSVDFKSLLVDESTVPKARRGRKATQVPELIEALSVVVPGKSLPLGSLFPKAETKEAQSKIGQTIRTHWAMVHATDGVKCSITWSDGQPFVSTRKVSA